MRPASSLATATDANTATDTIQVGVDRTIPGSLTLPTPNATVSGTVELVYTPTAGFPVNSVYFYYCNGSSAGNGTQQPDGTWTLTVDTNQCADGPASFTALHYWTDPLGGGQRPLCHLLAVAGL